MLTDILSAYGIDFEKCSITAFGNGLINSTWKVLAGEKAFILQRINPHVFEHPEYIDENIRQIAAYLKHHHPDYLFVGPLTLTGGQTALQTNEGYYRLLPFVPLSHSIDVVQTAAQAFEAARQFGRFSHLLAGFNASNLKYTLPDFHNLTLRYRHFTRACQTADKNRLAKAAEVIGFINDNQAIIETYNNLVSNNNIPLRVIHHDTKISNMLFDEHNRGLCVIDLDTVMPGYYLSDVGDMMRTYLSPVSEEEVDIDRIAIRLDFFKAIYDGYMAEMGDELSAAEKNLFIYAGTFMICMQAIRFLTDYLNNDVYYGSKYKGHNLVRAQNQINLLQKYMAHQADFKAIMRQS